MLGLISEIMIGVLVFLGIIATTLYIYNNSTELRIVIRNKAYIAAHKNDSIDPPEATGNNEYKGPEYKDLADAYRVPEKGCAKELEKFDGFDLYNDEVFDEENYNPPTGVFTHSSEFEDDGLDVPDIYDKEVAL